MSQWKLTQGDSLAELRELPTRSVDAVMCDPPYSSGGQFRSDRTGSTRNKYLNNKNTTLADYAGDNRDQRGFLAWSSLWLAECWRIARDGAPIAVFTDWRQLPTMSDALQAGGWIWRGLFVWNKTEAARPEKGRPRNQAEYILWGSKGPMPRHDDMPCLPGVYTQYLPPTTKQHQADKPIGVWSTLLPMVAAGGLVLDPFAGSGSVGVACVQAGYDYHGIEISEAWAEYARERIEAEGEHQSTVEATRNGQSPLF